MNRLRTWLRLAPRALALLPGLVLLGALVVGALHDHPREDGGHRCAICSLSHAPAAPTLVAAVEAPTVRPELLSVPVEHTPRTLRVAAASTRGPPSA